MKDAKNMTSKNPLSIVMDVNNPAYSFRKASPPPSAHPRAAVAEFTPEGLALLARLRADVRENELSAKYTVISATGEDTDKGIRVRWLDRVSDRTMEGSAVMPNVNMAGGDEDVEWRHGSVSWIRLGVHDNQFWFEAHIDHPSSGRAKIESELVFWSDIEGLSERLDATIAAARREEEDALPSPSM